MSPQQLDQLDVGWFEEPLDPTKDAEGLALVARRVKMDIADGEGGYGQGFFAELLARGAAEIIMPDIQYCAGVAEAHRAAHKAVQSGHGVSLHSPSGPVSQLAGAHVTAAVPGALPLEHAVHEAPWRAELLSPPERIAGGRLWFPGGPGLGARLDHAVTSRYGRRWRG